MAVAVDMQFMALAGRIVVLEAGGAVLEAGGSCSVLAGLPPADVALFIDADA